MKKRIIALTLVLLMMFSTVSFAARAVKITLNGKELKTDVAPVIKNNRTLVPIRFISEALGYKVEWKEETKEVTIVKDNNKLILTIGNTTSLLNDVKKENDVAPEIMENRTFVPLRFIAENFSIKVDWDDANSTVLLSTDKAVNVGAILENIDMSSLTESEKTYVQQFVKSQQQIIAKLAEFKKFAFEDFSKHSKNDLLLNFNRINTEILDLVADARSITVPDKFKASNEFYKKTLEGLLPMIDKFKLAFLEDSTKSAVELVDQFTKFSMNATEALDAIKAEIKGIPYVPQTDITTYKNTQNEVIGNLFNKIEKR